MPAPLPPDEAARQHELVSDGLPDTPLESMLARIARLAARVCKTPIAFISLLNHDGQMFCATVGLELTGGLRDEAICGHTVLEDRTLIVPDATLDGRFRGLAPVVGPPHIRFYAGTPLTARQRHRVGTLCVMDPRPRDNFGPDEALILEEMAALVMEEIEFRHTADHGLTELEMRKRADQTMRASRDELEARIAQRTTALVEAEARYRGIFENAVEGIYQARPDGGLLGVNPAFAHLLGYASPESLLVTVPDLGLLYVRPNERTDFAQRLEAEGIITSLETEIFRSDGARIWISENARAIRDGEGKLLRYEGTVEDITARRRTEEALQHAHEELEERVRERTAELALLNGDLRQLIAQREHAEATVRRSENKFRALVENAQDLTSIITPDGVLVYNTPSSLHILGATADELLGENIFRGRLHPDDHAAIGALLQRVIETGESYVRTECRLRHHDGSWRLLESITSPLPPDFPLIGVVVNSRDITERRRTEREAQARARQQGAIAELGRHALQGVDVPEFFHHTARLVAEALELPLTSVCEVLPDGEHLLLRAGVGWQEGAVGHAVADFWRAGQPTDQRPNNEPLVLPDLSQAPRFPVRLGTASGAIPVSAVSALIHSDGRVFGTLSALSVEPRAFSPSEIAFLQTVADLISTVVESRRHQAASREVEARYQRIAANTPGMVYQSIRRADGGTAIPFVSEGCRQIYGLEPAQLRANPALMNDRIHPDDQARVFAALAESNAALTPLQWEGRIVLPSGDVRWVTVRSRPELLPNGDIYRDGVVIDVTELKRTQDAMRAAKEEAEKANLAKSEFLSRMSHELRTPLNAILGFGQLLDLEDLSPSQNSSVEQILKGGRHLLDLINEVLDIARIEAGKMEFKLETVDVNEALAAAADFVRPLARQHDIQLVSSSRRPPRPVLVRADRGRLDQVLFNLLSNGVKYNREGGRLRLACRRPDERTVRVLVADTGPGLAPDDIARLFTPFQRLNAAERGIAGTGIGLTISRSLAAAMGGKINVISRPGRGSIFSLDLPADSGEDVPVPPLADADDTVQDSDGLSVVTPPVRTILHIDDQPANLSLIERMLDGRPNLRLVNAVDARSGLARARELRPDLILLDLHLPDLPGDEVVRRLAVEVRTRNIPVIVLSADATPAQVKRLHDLGVHDYLVKPFKMQALLGAVDTALPDQSKDPRHSSCSLTPL